MSSFVYVPMLHITLLAVSLSRYYAAPTMHHAILQEASVRYVKTLPPTKSVKFVANAAGGLVSSLLKDYCLSTANLTPSCIYIS